MSNSFNISVKPEISGVADDIAANLVQILSNASALASIRTVDVLAINTNINDNEAKLVTIDSIVDAIKIKTDLTPQNVRGKYFPASLVMNSDTFTEVANVTGHGKLHQITIRLVLGSDTLELLVTIDGEAFTVLSHTGDVNSYNAVASCYNVSSAARNLKKVLIETTSSFNSNLEFESSLLVEVRKTVDAGNNIECKVGYTLDDF